MKFSFSPQTPYNMPLSEIRAMYDRAAELHNRALQEMAETPGFDSLNAEDRFKTAQDYAAKVYPKVDINAIFSETEFVSLDQQLDAWIARGESSKLAEYLLNEGAINQAQADFITELYAAIESVPFEKLEKAVDKVIGLEVDLIARKDLSDEEKAILVAATSIARHTVHFWAKAANDGGNPWGPVARLRIPRWLKDLAGFTVGALVGTAIGGPAVGAAGGTLVGTAASN